MGDSVGPATASVVPGVRLRWILPTPLGLVLVLVFLVALSPIEDSDLFLHLATGRHVLAGTIPRLDPFSHTAGGREWLAHEWLAGTIFESIRRLGGLGLLVWIKAVLSAVFVWLITVIYRSRGVTSPLAITVGAAAAAVCVKNVLLVRPHLATLLMVPTTLIVLTGRRLWAAAILPPLYTLWANCHGGFILGAIPFAMVGLDEVDRWIRREGTLGLVRQEKIWSRLSTLVAVGVLCLAAVLINPHGAHLLAFPFQFDPRAPFLSLIDEWAPPDYKRFVPHEMVLLAIVVAPLLWPIPVSAGEVLGLLTGLHLALTAIRSWFLVGVLGTPIVARCLEVGVRSNGWLGFLDRRFQLASSGRGTITPVCLAALATLPWAISRDFVDSRRFPVEAVGWIREHRPPGNLYNEYDHGGYLIWALPEYPVFIDGRIEIFHRHGVLADYLRIADARVGWDEVLARRGAGVALVRPDSPARDAFERSQSYRRACRSGPVDIYVRVGKRGAGPTPERTKAPRDPLEPGR